MNGKQRSAHPNNGITKEMIGEWRAIGAKR